MASADEKAGGPFASTSVYSTTSDHIYAEAHQPGEYPHGRVDPAPAPADEKSKKHPRHDHVDRPVDSQVMADPRGTRLAEEGNPAVREPAKKPSRWKGRLVVGLIVGTILGAALYWGVPAVQWAMATV